MRTKINVIFIFLMLVISAVAVNAISISKTIKSNQLEKQNSLLFENNPEAELPIWSVGDSWTFYGSIKGKQGNSVSFDLDFDNMLLEVSIINPTNYTVDINVPQGDITGFGSVDLDILPKISGDLKDTSINGFFYVNKTDLAIDMAEVSIQGTVDAIIDIDFTADLSTLFYSGVTFERMMYNSLEFPIFLNSSWIREDTYIMSDMIVSLLPDPTNLYFDIAETNYNCQGWDIVDVSDTDYDALKIKRNTEENYIFYSPRAGNIIKVDFRNIDLGYGYSLNRFLMNLKSTSYFVSTNPPNKPSTPDGESSLEVGIPVEYNANALDPDGDKIRYIFEFSDGTTKTSDFVESGINGSVEKTWVKKGTFEVKVKARDKWGGESDFSDVLTVDVLNDAPEKPDMPDGPMSGRIKRKSYTYDTSTIDSNGHRVRFIFDWGDGTDSYTSYVDSGASASATHIWYRQGDFQIKVKAEDEYGEESEWSDPLVVSMPKAKHKNLDNFLFMSMFLQKYPKLNHFLNFLLA